MRHQMDLRDRHTEYYLLHRSPLKVFKLPQAAGNTKFIRHLTQDASTGPRYRHRGWHYQLHRIPEHTDSWFENVDVGWCGVHVRVWPFRNWHVDDVPNPCEHAHDTVVGDCCFTSLYQSIQSETYLGHLLINNLLWDKISFVSDQQLVHMLVCIPVNFRQPSFDIVKRLLVSNVIHDLQGTSTLRGISN